MLRSTITGGTLDVETTRRADGRADGADDEHHQGKVVEAARPHGETFRPARLLVREAARTAPERETRRRRRGHGEEAARASDADARAERREAGHSSATGCRAGA